jgi:hypothetical protein
MRHLALVLALVLAWANPAQAQIAFRSADIQTAGSSGTITIPVPSGTAADDVVVACLLYQENTPGEAISSSNGFTQQAESFYLGDSPDWRLTTWTKRATGSEGTNYVWTKTTGAWRYGVAASFSGVTTSGNGIDTVGTGSNGFGTSQTATGITPTTSDTMLVACYTAFSSAVPTAPSGMTNARPSDTSSYAQIFYQGHTSGATGDRVMTTAASTSWNGLMIALQQAGGAASSPKLTLLGVGGSW